MANKNKGKKSQLTRKTALKQIAKVLETTLGDLHMALGEKKFKRRIRKASKILTTDLPRGKSKKIKVKKIVLEENHSDLPLNTKPQAVSALELQ